MYRGFKYLIDAHGLAGARDIFEKICVQICQEIYGEDAKSVRNTQGDGGIDVLIGDLPNPSKVYQCKFFPDKLDSSQKQQIIESFETVIQNYKPNEWLLCLPLILSQDELLWWSKWKSMNEESSKITINLCDGSYLINKLKSFKIYDETFDDDIRESLQKVLIFLGESKKKIADEIIYGYEDKDNIISNYEESIFVKMLLSANITDVNTCVIEFYNSEIAKYSSNSKDLVEGKKIYYNLKQKIYTLWNTQYRIYHHPFDGNQLLIKTNQRIEDLDSTTLESTEDYSLLAKKGVLHQLANEKEIGWIENYIEKLVEYMRGQL